MCPHFLPVTVLFKGATLHSAVSLVATSGGCPFFLWGLSGFPRATATAQLEAETFHRIIAVAFGSFSCQFPEEFAQTQTDYVTSWLKQSVLFTARRIKSKPLSAAPHPHPLLRVQPWVSHSPPLPPSRLPSWVLSSVQAELLAVPRWVEAAWSAGLQTMWLLTRTRWLLHFGAEMSVEFPKGASRGLDTK